MKKVIKRFEDLLERKVKNDQWELNEYEADDLTKLNDIIGDMWPETYDSKEDRHRTALALISLADELLNDENFEDEED